MRRVALSLLLLTISNSILRIWTRTLASRSAGPGSPYIIQGTHTHVSPAAAAGCCSDRSRSGYYAGSNRPPLRRPTLYVERRRRVREARRVRVAGSTERGVVPCARGQASYGVQSRQDDVHGLQLGLGTCALHSVRGVWSLKLEDTVTHS
jgi:hypothetical protein